MTRRAPTLGPYQLDRVIGRGAMGEVWSATHPSGRRVAVKRIALQGDDAERLQTALGRELRAIAALDHPNILVVLDAGVATASEDVAVGPFVVTELASGTLAAPTQRTFAEIRDILTQILAGLAHAHARGIIHRDLKPENVLQVGATWKLADFGIARDAREDPGTTLRAAGSPAYMAPEQLRGQLDAQGPWTDLYALGCVAWELVAGAPPYVRDTLEGVVRAHVIEPIPSPVGWTTPPAYLPWLRRLLAKDPASRFRRAADASWALAEIADDDTLRFPAFQGSSPTWATGAHLSLAPLAAADDAPQTPVVPPPIPARWPASQQWDPIPRHGAELALIGLRRPPLAGRGAERDALWDALRAVHAEQQARLVLVTGPSGVGRSRLLAALSEVVRQLGVADVLHRDAERSDLLPLDPLALRNDRPCVVTLDDVDEDPGARTFLTTMVQSRSLYAVPVLVVATVSDEALRSDPDLAAALDTLLRLDGTARLVLPPLAAADVSDLVRQVLRLEEVVLEDLVARSAGNPRFAVDAIAGWAQTGLLSAGPTHYSVPSVVPVPQSLERLGAEAFAVALRGRRTDDARALEVLAVLGQRAAVTQWQALCAATEVHPAADWTAALTDLGVLTTRGGALAFANPLIRAYVERVARDSGRWQPLHRRAADLLGDLGSPLERGRHLVESGADREALPLLLRSRGGPDAVRQEGVALRLRAEALTRLGVPAEAREWAEQASAQAITATQRGDMGAAEQFAERALALAHGQAWHEVVSEANRALTTVRRLSARQSIEPARAMMRAAVAQGGPIALTVRKELALALEGANRGDEALTQANRLFEEFPQVATHSGGLLRVRALLAYHRGDFQSAWDDAAAGLALDACSNHEIGLGFSHQILGEIAFAIDDFADARHHHTRALALQRAAGNLFGVFDALARLAKLNAVTGDLETAEAQLASALALASGLGLGVAHAMEAHVAVALARGQPDAALRLLLPDAMSPDLSAPLRAGNLALVLECQARQGRLASDALDPLDALIRSGTLAPPEVSRSLAQVVHHLEPSPRTEPVVALLHLLEGRRRPRRNA